MKYRYFVSYSYNNGFGNMEIIRDVKIRNMQDIQLVTQVMESDLFHKNIFGVVIINFILLED